MNTSMSCLSRSKLLIKLLKLLKALLQGKEVNKPLLRSRRYGGPGSGSPQPHSGEVGREPQGPSDQLGQSRPCRLRSNSDPILR